MNNGSRPYTQALQSNMPCGSPRRDWQWFSGVRALYDDGSDKPEDVTRDYQLGLDSRDGKAPLLTVYGGKITTYRRLAEAALARLGRYSARTRRWTAQSTLPGGEFSPDAFDSQTVEAMRRWPFLSRPHARRMLHAYGLRMEGISKTRAAWTNWDNALPAT